MKCWAWTIILGLVLGGCATRPPEVAPAPAAGAPDPVAVAPAAQTPLMQSKVSQVIFVNMFQFTVPYGAVSRNEKFWKDVDESALDLETYDRLLRNGIRVGTAPLWAWSDLGSIIDKEVTRYRTDRFTTFSGGDSLAVAMTPEMDDELLFTLDSHGVTGRWYDFCQNRFDFSFQWERHVEDTIRVNICPLVTVHRVRWDYFLADTPEERKLISDEYLWDLAIRADLRKDDFLVIAPSLAADDPYRVGNKFLTHDGPSYRTEQVLVLTRSPLVLNHAKATTEPVVTMGK
jgi:hypothetical protein